MLKKIENKVLICFCLVTKACKGLIFCIADSVKITCMDIFIWQQGGKFISKTAVFCPFGCKSLNKSAFRPNAGKTNPAGFPLSSCQGRDALAFREKRQGDMDILGKNGGGPGDGRHLEGKGAAQAKLPVLEERLTVGKREMETGSVLLRKTVSIEEVEQEVALASEEVQVERVAIGRYVETAPAVRQEGDVTIVPVVKEVLVVEKRLMLTEELHIVRKRSSSVSTVKEQLRKEEIEISRTGSAQEGTGTATANQATDQ